MRLWCVVLLGCLLWLIVQASENADNANQGTSPEDSTKVVSEDTKTPADTNTQESQVAAAVTPPKQATKPANSGPDQIKPKKKPTRKARIAKREEERNKRIYEALTSPLIVPGLTTPSSSTKALAGDVCSPTLFRVDEELSKGVTRQFRWQALSAQDVLKHLLVTLPNTVFGKVPETPFSNVDGRISRPILGAMGGDAGEFILGLQAFESVFERQLTDFQVAALFSDFLASVAKSTFFLQTDHAALLSLCRTIKFCMPSSRLDSPPPDMITVLQDELIKPQNMGCGHIKHLMMFPERFGVRQGLIEAFLRAFFNLLWGVPANRLDPAAMAILRAKLRLQVLQGPHTEGAIVKVHTAKCRDEFIPMIPAEHGKVSLGLVHVDAVAKLRQLTSMFLYQRAMAMDVPQLDGEATVQKLFGAMNDASNKIFNEAVLMDNGQTPVFNVHYPAECCGGSKL